MSPAVVEHSIIRLKPKFNEPQTDEQRPWVWLLSVGVIASQQFREALAFLAAYDTKFSNCAVAPSKSQDGPIIYAIQGWLKKGSGEMDTKSKRARLGRCWGLGGLYSLTAGASAAAAAQVDAVHISDMFLFFVIDTMDSLFRARGCCVLPSAFPSYMKLGRFTRGSEPSTSSARRRCTKQRQRQN